MSNMKVGFYLFGAPIAFASTADEPIMRDRLQSYDGGTEKSKLTIKRCFDNSIDYVFYKSNFITSGNRDKANFGMCLHFENCYFEDVKYIYELLEIIFEEVIMKDGIMFDKLQNGAYKYKFSSFENIKSYIEKLINMAIQRNVLKNTNSVKPLQNLGEYKSGSSGIVKLNSKKLDNNEIINTLKMYNYISISPEYETSVNTPKQIQTQQKNNIPKKQIQEQDVYSKTMQNAQAKVPQQQLLEQKLPTTSEKIKRWLSWNMGIDL